MGELFENFKKIMDGSLKIAKELHEKYQLKESELIVAKIEQTSKWFEELKKKI